MENKIILQKYIPERNHLTRRNKIDRLDNAFFLSCIMYVFMSKNALIKPVGFWYSLKWYWIENLNISMQYTEIEYEKNDKKVYEVLQNQYLYEVVLQENVFVNLQNKGLNKILLLEKWEDFELFYEIYKYTDKDDDFSKRIDWKKVYMDYGGIELRTVHLDKLFKWTYRNWWYGWDIPSGCIWNKDLIYKIRLVL